MDRLAAYASWHDNQALDQAVMVARRQRLDWDELRAWAGREGIDPKVVERIRKRSSGD
jgi:hypothetical protein